MMKSNTLLYTSIVLVAFLAIWLGFPQRELDWENEVVPMAQAQMAKTSATPYDGVIVVLTGATSGIGLSLTKALSRLGATVVAIGRSPKKLARLQEDVPRVVPVVADLTDLQSVSRAASEIQEKFDHVDVLINNAGMHYKFTLEHPSTPQGYDEVFGVNYLSHFLLTEKLLPSLLNSTMPTLLEMSSTYHWAVDGSDLDASGGMPKAARPGSTHILWWRDQRAYANSKLAQILNMRALERIPSLSKIRMASVCPGWVGTQIAGQEGTLTHFLLHHLAFDSDSWGLSSTCLALLDDNSTNDFYISSRLPNVLAKFVTLLCQPWTYTVGLRDLIGGMFAGVLIFGQKFVPDAHATMSSPESYNVTLQDSLYEWSKLAVADYL